MPFKKNVLLLFGFLISLAVHAEELSVEGYSAADLHSFYLGVSSGILAAQKFKNEIGDIAGQEEGTFKLLKLAMRASSSEEVTNIEAFKLGASNASALLAQGYFCVEDMRLTNTTVKQVGNQLFEGAFEVSQLPVITAGILDRLGSIAPCRKRFSIRGFGEDKLQSFYLGLTNAVRAAHVFYNSEILGILRLEDSDFDNLVSLSMGVFERSGAKDRDAYEIGVKSASYAVANGSVCVDAEKLQDYSVDLLASRELSGEVPQSQLTEIALEILKKLSSASPCKPPYPIKQGIPISRVEGANIAGKSNPPSASLTELKESSTGEELGKDTQNDVDSSFTPSIKNAAPNSEGIKEETLADNSAQVPEEMELAPPENIPAINETANLILVLQDHYGMNQTAEIYVNDSLAKTLRLNEHTYFFKKGPVVSIEVSVPVDAQEVRVESGGERYYLNQKLEVGETYKLEMVISRWAGNLKESSFARVKD